MNNHNLNPSLISRILANLLIIASIFLIDAIAIVNVWVLSAIFCFFVVFKMVPVETKFKIHRYYIWLVLIALIINILLRFILKQPNGLLFYHSMWIFFCISICLLNIYFSRTKNENRVNVISLIIIIILLSVLHYQKVPNEYKIAIVPLFMALPFLLYFFKVKSIDQRLNIILIHKPDFNTQEVLYNIFNDKILDEKNRQLALEKISDVSCLKRILFNDNEEMIFREYAFSKLPADEIFDNITNLPDKLSLSKISQIEDQQKLIEIIDKHPEKYGLMATRQLFITGQLIYTDKTVKYLTDNIFNEYIDNANEFGISEVCRRILDYNGLAEDETKIRLELPIGKLISWYKEQDLFNYEIQWSVCSCFELYPSALALNVLQKNWLKIEKEIRLIQYDEKNEPNYDMEIAAAAVLRALGACAARDQEYKNLDNDKLYIEKITNNINEIQAIKDIMSELFEKQKQVMEKYPNRDEALKNADFISINNELHNKKNRSEQLENEIYKSQSNLSAANIIQRVLQDGQRYSSYVRQNALIGLEYLINNSHLNQQAKAELKKPLEDFYKLKEKNEDINTYEVRLFIGGEKGEIIYVLKKAFQNISDGQSINSSVLESIVDEIIDKLPTAIAFLENYPLKLMTSSTKKLFGYYSQSGFKLEYWSRYTPPKDIGEVQSRFMRVRNFIQPNSMGLDYRLFNHELLVVPVLYHEYLHYTGIKNEAEVWLRENLFLRYLIAEDAKKQKNLIEYHLKIMNEFEKINDFGTLFLLSFPPNSIELYHHINDIIIEIYGKTLTREEAFQYAEDQIKQNDLKTLFNNFTLIWHPEVHWPLLNEKNAEFEKKAIENIAIEHKTQNNLISEAEFNNILKEAEISRWIDSWNDYQNKIFDYIKSPDNYRFVYEKLIEYFINRV